MYLFLNII